MEGYGTNSNGWEQEKRFAIFGVSPQNPPHPLGDTLYFSALKPYIDGLVYNDTAYTAQYQVSTNRPIRDDSGYFAFTIIRVKVAIP